MGINSSEAHALAQEIQRSSPAEPGTFWRGLALDRSSGWIDGSIGRLGEAKVHQWIDSALAGWCWGLRMRAGESVMTMPRPRLDPKAEGAEGGARAAAAPIADEPPKTPARFGRSGSHRSNHTTPTTQYRRTKPASQPVSQHGGRPRQEAVPRWSAQQACSPALTLGMQTCRRST